MLTKNIYGLQNFYKQMWKKIEDNEPEKEDSWVRCDIKYLEDVLKGEIREYETSGDKSELIDIANICMMLYNRKEKEQVQVRLS